MAETCLMCYEHRWLDSMGSFFCALNVVLPISISAISQLVHVQLLYCTEMEGSQNKSYTKTKHARYVVKSNLVAYCNSTTVHGFSYLPGEKGLI